MISTQPTRAAPLSEEADRSSAITNTGQCHRYTEYEIRPSQRTGASPSTTVAPPAPPPIPPAMTSAVPPTGSIAADPGKAVEEFSVNDARSTRARPTHVAATRSDPGILADRDGEDGDEHAGAELPSTGERREVRRRAVDRGLVHRPPEGGGDDCQQTQPQRPRCPTDPLADCHEHEQETGPDEIELLLHGERPVVLQRRRRDRAREVIRALVDEPEVGGERRRPATVDGGRLPDQWSQLQVGRHDGHDDDETGDRQDATGTARIETDHRHPAAAANLVDQQRRDQKTRDHEEDVDAGVTAAHTGYTGVQEHHQADGDPRRPSMSGRNLRPGAVVSSNSVEAVKTRIPTSRRGP